MKEKQTLIENIPPKYAEIRYEEDGTPYLYYIGEIVLNNRKVRIEIPHINLYIKSIEQTKETLFVKPSIYNYVPCSSVTIDITFGGKTEEGFVVKAEQLEEKNHLNEDFAWDF